MFFTLKNTFISVLVAGAQKIAVFALCVLFAGILFTCKNEPEPCVTYPPCPDGIADVEAKIQEYMNMEYSMYVGGKKYIYQVTPDQMMIQRFDSRIDTEEIWNTLQRKSVNAQKVTQLRNNLTGFFEVELDNYSNEQVIDLVAHWNVLEKDTYVFPILYGLSNGMIAFVPDRISIRLKNENDYSLLLRTLQTYHVKSIELQSLFGDQLNYMITTDCPHQRNAMQIANELTESGLFEYAAPEIIMYSRK